MAGALPPIFVISDDEHGGYAAVALYTLLILTVIIVATRLSARYYIGKIIQTDDYLIISATVLAIIQSAFVQLAINHGLGRKQATLSTHNFDLFEKYTYAAQILIILVLALSKISIALLFKNLMTKGYVFWSALGLIGVIVVWAVVSIFVLAFRCAMPTPWDITGRCLNQYAIFHSIAAINIITDVALVLLPCVVLWGVQVSTLKRIRIVGLVAIRLFVPIVVGFQIHYMNTLLGSADKSWNSLNSTIWDQVMLNLSIIATAIPSLGRLAVELQPNVNAFAITDQHGIRGARDKYVLSSIASGYPQNYNFAVDNRLGTHTSVHVTSARRTEDEEDSESMEGLVKDGLSQNVIQQTIDIKVD